MGELSSVARLRGFKSAEPEKTVKRSSRRTGVNLQFFPVEPTSLGLKGASSPFFVAPARRNRWWFSGSLLPPKENIPRLPPLSPAEAILNRSTTKNRRAAYHGRAAGDGMLFQVVTGLPSRSPRRAACRPRQRGRHRRAPAGNRRHRSSVPRRSGRRCYSWAAPFWQ